MTCGELHTTSREYESQIPLGSGRYILSIITVIKQFAYAILLLNYGDFYLGMYFDDR